MENFKDEEEFDEKAHAALLKGLQKLDGNNRKIGREKVVRLASYKIPTLNTKDILKKIGSELLTDTSNELESLPKPLEKPAAKRLKRAAGYEDLAIDANKWEAIVNQRRRAEQLTFPLHQADIRVITTEKNFKPLMKSNLEKDVYAILSGAKLQEEKQETEEEKEIKKAMSLKEIRLKSREIWRARILRQRIEKKAALLNKSKSRKYHRILRRERLRRQKEKFERLRHVNPKAALEILNEIEKERIKERMTLRHKRSKWLDTQHTRAGQDPTARSALTQNAEIRKDLLEKLKACEKEQEAYDRILQEQEKLIEKGVLDPANAWVSQMARAPKKEEEEKQNLGFLKMKNFWEDVHKRKVVEIEAQKVVERLEEEGDKGERGEVEIEDKEGREAEEVQEGRMEDASTLSAASEGTSRGEEPFESFRSKSPKKKAEEAQSKTSEKNEIIRKTIQKDSSLKEMTDRGNIHGKKAKETEVYEDKESKSRTLRKDKPRKKMKHEQSVNESKKNKRRAMRKKKIGPDTKKKSKKTKKELKIKEKQRNDEEKPKMKKTENEDVDSEGKAERSSPKKKITKTSDTRLRIEGVETQEDKDEESETVEKVQLKNKINGNKREQSGHYNKSKENEMQTTAKSEIAPSVKGEVDAKKKGKNNNESKIKETKRIWQEKTKKKGKKRKKYEPEKVEEEKDEPRKENMGNRENKSERKKTSGLVDRVYIDDLFDRLEGRLFRKLEEKEARLEAGIKPLPERRQGSKEETPPIQAYDLEFDFTVQNGDDHQMDESLTRVTTLEDLERLPFSSPRRDKSVTMETAEVARETSEIQQPVSIVNVQDGDILKIKSRRMGRTVVDYSHLRHQDNFEEEMEDDLEELFEDDENIKEFKSEKEAEQQKIKPVDTVLAGWGCWTGPGIVPSAKKKKKCRFTVPPRRPKKCLVGNVIYNEENDVHANIRKVMVSQLPYPYTRVRDFEASLRQSVGRKFVPETVHRKLTAPPVVQKMGTVIAPMDEEVLLKNYEKARRKSKIEALIERKLERIEVLELKRKPQRTKFKRKKKRNKRALKPVVVK